MTLPSSDSVFEEVSPFVSSGFIGPVLEDDDVCPSFGDVGALSPVFGDVGAFSSVFGGVFFLSFSFPGDRVPMSEPSSNFYKRKNLVFEFFFENV